MIETIISSLCAIIICVLSNLFSLSRTRNENDKNIALINYKLSELSERVNKHNNVVERMTILEHDVNIIKKGSDEQ